MKAFVDFQNIVYELNNENIILYPSDTILGLGCDATSFDAVQKLFNIKNRPQEKGFVVLVSSIKMLFNYVNIDDKIITFLNNYHRPISIIYKSCKNLAKNVLHNDGSVAIRLVQKNCFCKELIDHFKKPLISTSANISGFPSPLTIKKVDNKIIKSVNLVVDVDSDIDTIYPSDIAKIEGGSISFIRKFDVST